MQMKTSINIAIIGHVNVGKSTLTGHLLFKCGAVEQQAIDNMENNALQVGMGAFKYAWLLDKMKAERERGFTIDVGLTKFETNKFCVSVIDTPGHKDFIKNMITGTSHADCVVLVVSASTGQFEAGMSQNGLTREHIVVARALGVKQMIVAVNKMESTVPPFSEERFDVIKKVLSKCLTRVGYELDAVAFVPISGWDGDNLVKESTNMAWYKGWEITRGNAQLTGKTLLDALDAIEPPARPTDKPLRFPIGNVYMIKGVGTVISGRVKTGILKSGMNITIAPKNVTTKVWSVEMDHMGVDLAMPGDIAGINVSKVPVKELRRGFICSDSNNDPARKAVSFVAKMVIMNRKKGIKPGYTPVIDIHNAHIPCEFVEFLTRIDKRSGAVVEQNPQRLLSGDAATVRLVPLKPLCVETRQGYSPLGRFVARDNKNIVCFGEIIEVTKCDFD